MMTHPLFRGALGVTLFIIVALLLAQLIPPAIAAISIPITDRIVIQLGDLPPWIIAIVAAGGLWKSWMAEKRAAESLAASRVNAVSLGALGEKIDGMLVDRDADNKAKGEAVGIKAGEDKADTLAEGQRQGREQATSPAPSAAGLDNTGSPIPVTDKRATDAAVRSAKALERAAETQEKIADKNKKKEV